MRKLDAYLRNIDGKIVLFYIYKKKNNNNPSWIIIYPVIFYNKKKTIYIYIFLKTLIYVITLKLRNTNDICICRPCTWRFDGYLLTDRDKNGFVKNKISKNNSTNGNDIYYRRSLITKHALIFMYINIIYILFGILLFIE